MKMKTGSYKKIALSLVAISVLGLGFSGCSSSTSKVEEKKELVLNEIKANIPEDEHSKQYIELRGEPSEIIKNKYLLVIDGDEDNEGIVDYAYNLDGVKVGENGLIIIKNKDEYNDIISSKTTVINESLFRTYDPDVDGEEYEDGILEHDAITYAIVETKSEIKRGDDLDNNNDGILELPKDAKVVDSFGSLDGGDGFVYSDVILSQSASDPDAATRFYNDLDKNSLSSWANGDIYEDPNKDDSELGGEVLYDTLQASSNLPPKAELTPGNHNFKKAPFVLINEVVNTGEKYVELLSNSSQNLDDIYLAAIEDNGKVNFVVSLAGVNAKETGITIIRDSSSSITIGNAIEAVDYDLSALKNDENTSLVLLYSKDTEISSSLDFDLNDDGKIDLPKGAIILDNIGWGTTKYSNIVNKDTLAAIRYKDNKMASLASWSFDETLVTPANTNIAETSKNLVKPTLETKRTVQSFADADDIAFWIHPTDSKKSLVIGTQKKAGYSIYDMDGNTLLDENPGNIRFNNVDIVYGFDLNGTATDIAIFTDRITNKFAIYKMLESAPYIENITDTTSSELFNSEEEGGDTAYGLAVYKSLENAGKVYAFATRNGYSELAKYELKVAENKIGWNKLSTITLAGDEDDDKHAEGMVVDQEYGKLYIAQEEVGIYSMDAELNTDLTLGEDSMIMEEGDNDLVEDLEGLTLYYKSEGTGYFIVSSQGNNTFGVFDRTNVSTKNSFVDSFVIVDDMNGIDGVQETDSIDVTNIAISDNFPNGAFISQDGIDTTSNPDDTETNFKWVKWENIASKLGDVTFTSTYDPRNPTNRR